MQINTFTAFALRLIGTEKKITISSDSVIQIDIS